jgi:hypothetical protein
VILSIYGNMDVFRLGIRLGAVDREALNIGWTLFPPVGRIWVSIWTVTGSDVGVTPNCNCIPRQILDFFDRRVVAIEA